MNKSEIIKKFNAIILSLLEQVSPLVGTKYLGYFKNIMKINAPLPIKNFASIGLKYKTKIMEKDPDYFLDENIFTKGVDENCDQENKEFYLNEILHLKTIYLTVDDESKENLWKISQALVLLSEEYLKLN